MVDSKFLNCTQCKSLFKGECSKLGVDVWGEGSALRAENNPAVWGAQNPKIYLLGFSKGKNQNKELIKVKSGESKFEDIPFKNMRHRLKWLLSALTISNDVDFSHLFSNNEEVIQSASLIRCSLSSNNRDEAYSYKMKGILKANPHLLEEIATNCAQKHLKGATPGSLFILLGLDPDYIKLCKKVMRIVFGPIRKIKDTTYIAGDMYFVHVAHPSSNQTDPQYKAWVAGETKVPKVAWAREMVLKSGVLNG
ncbi:hypothetical protein [Vibrio sp. PID23_8]|uniref:hypothetical protein n=1 Tax=Vibrio sp. PID23_8 TaxID=1583767 RepID=UPI000E686503|nr:hypothetical protein [Vibrio sp. PID23_8]RIZ55775.1 hypothetical protein AK966_04155 [Vibrio sp. PID23_8]